MDVEGENTENEETHVLGLEDIVVQYIREAAEEAAQDMYNFLAQFQVKIEVNVVEGDEPPIDFEALEKWLEEENDNG